jgi:hypothetical protein
MLYREIIAVCSEIHTKHINTLCGQNVEFVNVKPGGTYSNQGAFKGYRKVHIQRFRTAPVMFPKILIFRNSLLLEF